MGPDPMTGVLISRREFEHRHTGAEGRRPCESESRDLGDSSTNQGTAITYQKLGGGGMEQTFPQSP